ncbi:MAG: type II secretion system F family protein [Chloroflexi bacterium]|nr:type II secretion system F family protein [Chloroflexota bacterium]
MPPLAISLLAGIGIILVFVGLYLPRTGRDVVAERLASFTRTARTLEELELQQPFSERVLRPLIRRMADMMQRAQASRQSGRKKAQGPSGIEAIQLRLVMAGNPYGWTASDFMGTKAFAALVLGGILFFLMTVGGKGALGLVFGGIGAAMGWFGPDLIVRSKMQARQKAVQRSLPDALDLLVISVEAGLGFDAAIARMVEKKDNPLTREFGRVIAEMRVGRSRREALKDMIQRTNVPDLNNFVGAILQAEQLGVSVTKVLGVQADQMRTLRRQRAEELAAQLQLKMLVPIAIFIMPSLCVVIIGPLWPAMAAQGLSI